MKLAMLTDCYPPRLGGIESQVRDLSRQLVLAGHEVEVFTETSGPRGERGGHTATGDDGVTVHRLAIAGAGASSLDSTPAGVLVLTGDPVTEAQRVSGLASSV